MDRLFMAFRQLIQTRRISSANTLKQKNIFIHGMIGSHKALLWHAQCLSCHPENYSSRTANEATLSQEN